MARKTIKKTGKTKLTKLLPKKKPFIILMPEERDDGIHWLFWALIMLTLVFLVSLVVISWQVNSEAVNYIL